MRRMTVTGAAAVSLALLTGTAALACPWQQSAGLEGRVRIAQAASPAATPVGDQARPARGPQEQGSVATPAPPATTTQPTAATNQPPVVKQMNEQEAKKVEREGK
jgi:hypothetical protein